jgi:hypothetical protein
VRAIGLSIRTEPGLLSRGLGLAVFSLAVVAVTVDPGLGGRSPSDGGPTVTVTPAGTVTTRAAPRQELWARYYYYQGYDHMPVGRCRRSVSS